MRTKSKTNHKERVRRERLAKGEPAICSLVQINLPIKCVECGSEMQPRGEDDLIKCADGTLDEIWECPKHHFARVIFAPVAVVRLIPEGEQR